MLKYRNQPFETQIPRPKNGRKKQNFAVAIVGRIKVCTCVRPGAIAMQFGGLSEVSRKGIGVHLRLQVSATEPSRGSNGVKDFSDVAAGRYIRPGGKISASTSPLCVGYSDVPARDRMSAGRDSDGTHSIQTLHPICRHSSCQDVASSWMSHERLQPFNLSAVQSVGKPNHRSASVGLITRMVCASVVAFVIWLWAI